MNEAMAKRAAAWVAKRWGWADMGPSYKTSDSKYRVHRKMAIGIPLFNVDIGQVWQSEHLYITSMYECGGGCKHVHEFNHWYGGCDHHHIAVQLAMSKPGDEPRVDWAVAYDVDTLVRNVDRLMWERVPARTGDGPSYGGQSFMRLPLDDLYGAGGVIVRDYRLNMDMTGVVEELLAGETT